MKKYNDVAQGADNKYVDTTIDRDASDNICRNFGTTIELDDESPEDRLKRNMPNWEPGNYQAHADEEFEDLVLLGLDDETFIPGLDDLLGPTDNDLSAIENDLDIDDD